MDFEKLISIAMKEMNISFKKAIAGLMVFMCGYGSTEDFKDFINYYIKNQKRREDDE